MFAFSFTALHPLGFFRATLAFCGCIWLGAAAWSDEKATAFALDPMLSELFGPLDWVDEHRFPAQCDPLDPAVTVLDARVLDGEDAVPSGLLWIEGTVAGISERRNRWFINFGEDYRTDVTLSLQNRPLSMIRQFWPDPENWLGQRVRVRGFADDWNGVFIEWEFPAQLCFLGQVPYRR